MLPSGFHNSLVTGSSFHGDVTAEARLSSLAEKEGERERGWGCSRVQAEDGECDSSKFVS